MPYDGDLELSVRVLKGEHVNVNVVAAREWERIADAKRSLFGGEFRHYTEFEGRKTQTLRRRGRLSEGSC